MKSPIVVSSRNWLQVTTYLVVFVASLTVVFFAGYYKAEYDLGAILGGEVNVVEKILNQRDEIKRLKKEKLKAEQDREIEQEASKILREQFATLKLEIDRLNRDLSLYKSIVEPSKNDSGVYLKKLQVIPIQNTAKNKTENRKIYRYQIILAQKSKQRSYTRGKIILKFLSDASEPANNVIVEDAKGKTIKSKNYKFRYYQELDGKIKIPENMRIKQVKVIIDHAKKKYDDMEYVVDWQDSKETSYVGK